MKENTTNISLSTEISRELMDQASSLHLCMHLGENSVDVLVADVASGLVKWSSQSEIKINDNAPFQDAVAFVLSKNWSERVFRKCTLSFDSSNFTLIPSAFFNEEKKSELLQFHTGIDHRRVQHKAINELNAELIFDLPDLFDSLIHKFQNGRIFPSAYLFLKFTKAMHLDEVNKLFILQSNGLILINVYKQRQLVLANSFSCTSNEDVLYHIANCAMRLELDLEHVKIYLCQGAEDSSTIELLSNYCRGLINIRSEISFNENFNLKMHLVCA